MSDIRHPGREAYETFCLALGANANWDTLPHRSQVAWFAVECRCAGIPHTALLGVDGRKAIEAASYDPDQPAAHRDRVARIAELLGPNEPRGAPLRSHVKDPSPFAYIPIMPGTLDAGPRQSVIPAEMEHLDRALMVGGAVLDPGDDDRYLRTRLADGHAAAHPLFSHIIGFPRGHVEEKYFDARAAMDQMTTLQVDVGDHPVTGRYLVSRAALKMMEQGEVVELVREPGAYSIDAAPIGGRGMLPSELADEVRATLDGYLADLKSSPGVILGNIEPEPVLKHVSLDVARHGGAVSHMVADILRYTPATDLPRPDDVRGVPHSEPVQEDPYTVNHGQVASGPAVTADVAKSMGSTFTGGCCDHCASFAMVRTGKCDTCQECGRSGGCG